MKKGKKRFSIAVLLLLLLTVTIGFSALSTNLNILGTSKIGTVNWDVHFENIGITSGSVTATTAPTIDNAKTKITYAVELNTPGDFYEFTVDVKNAGTVDAKLESLPTLSGVSSTQAVYTDYTFKHSDGSAVAAGETIAAGSSRTYKVRVEFKSNVASADLPTTTQNMNLSVDMNYVQV